MDKNIEIPLSNAEVLDIISSKKNSNINNKEKFNKILKYLQDTKIEDKYPFGLLRQLKSEEDIEASLETLCMLSNTNNLNLVSGKDKQQINEYLKKHTKH